MSALRSRLQGTPSLRDFLHRSKVLSQYRTFLRELVGLDKTTATEIRVQIREAYEMQRSEKNLANRKAALQEGARQLQFLRTYVGTTRRAQEAAGMAPGESWVGTGEAWDVRGRIGEGWAWSSDAPAEAGSDSTKGVGRVTTKQPK